MLGLVHFSHYADYPRNRLFVGPMSSSFADNLSLLYFVLKLFINSDFGSKFTKINPEAE